MELFPLPPPPLFCSPPTPTSTSQGSQAHMSQLSASRSCRAFVVCSFLDESVCIAKIHSSAHCMEAKIKGIL